MHPVSKHIECLIWSVGLQSPVQACNVESLVQRMGGLRDGAQKPSRSASRCIIEITACTVEHCSWSATALGSIAETRKTLTRSGSPSLPRALLIMLLSICLFCLVYRVPCRRRAANVLPLGLFGQNLCARFHAARIPLVIRVIHNTCWWPPFHPLPQDSAPFHSGLTALRCRAEIVFKKDNAWDMDVIKFMHLCCAHTVCCTRKARVTFRPA